MNNLKKVISTIFCFSVLVGSITLVGCSHSHSHSHGGSHTHTPHDGILTSFSDSKGLSGYVELKLHDDKGDLELWLTDAAKNTPFDLPLDSAIKVTFLELGGKEVILKARNKVNNEDESGKGNIRNGKTNYFIFPGDTAQSAEFLIGKSFSSNVAVSFTLDGKYFKTDFFILRPHTH